MTQKKFSTLEECCEFVRQLRWLTPAQILEQKDDIVTMHIALTKHIDDIINRVCARHGLRCQWELSYRLKSFGICYSSGEIRLNPEALSGGANYFMKLILHELAHLTACNHRTNFWRTHITYMQEENLLPQGEITVRKVIRPSWIAYDKTMIKCNQLDLNGKRIVNWMSGRSVYDRFAYMTYFDDHNPLLAYREYNWAGLQRAKRAMKEILKNTRNRKELAIKVRL